MKKTWKVELKNNLTAYATFRCDDPGHECTPACGETTETDDVDWFETEEEALAHYNHMKASLRFAGSSGMYVTYPTQEEESA